jgi:hypothetical protein
MDKPSQRVGGDQSQEPSDDQDESQGVEHKSGVVMRLIGVSGRV